MGVILAGVLFTGTASAGTSWPSRSTPLGSTLGWFKAINAHDRQRLLFYVAPSSRIQMGWARPSTSWSKFRELHCRSLKMSTASNAAFLCRFHESASPTEGNSVGFWVVQLHRFKGVWLIVGYGQG